MKELTKWWNNYLPLNDNEKYLLSKKNLSEPEICSKELFKPLEREYFSRMPFCNVTEETHNITFFKQATDFINGLFDKFVDDDTLVIHSNNEHDNVKKNLINCKNTLELDYKEDILKLKIHNIIKESKKFKKVFVYIIGTQISTGEITPQTFFETLKKEFIINNIQHIIVIDDVHGMFLTPRDYSIFDYVLFTAHALVRPFDMGLMISKDAFMGIRAINWGYEYLEMLDVILKRKDKLRLFSQIMREEFMETILDNNIELCDYTTPHIFSLKTSGFNFTKTMYDILDNSEVRLEGIDNEYTYIRFRAQHYIKNPEYLTNGVELVYNIIKTAKTLK